MLLISSTTCEIWSVGACGSAVVSLLVLLILHSVLKHDVNDLALQFGSAVHVL